VLTVPESVRCFGGSRGDDEVRFFTDGSTQYRRTAPPSLHGIPVPTVHVGIPGTWRTDRVACQTHSLRWDQYRISHQPSWGFSATETRTGQFTYAFHSPFPTLIPVAETYVMCLWVEIL